MPLWGQEVALGLTLSFHSSNVCHNVQPNDIHHNATLYNGLWNDIQHDDIQYNDIPYDDIQQNGIQYNQIQHK